MHPASRSVRLSFSVVTDLLAGLRGVTEMAGLGQDPGKIWTTHGSMSPVPQREFRWCLRQKKKGKRVEFDPAIQLVSPSFWNNFGVTHMGIGMQFMIWWTLEMVNHTWVHAAVTFLAFLFPGSGLTTGPASTLLSPSFKTVLKQQTPTPQPQCLGWRSFDSVPAVHV